jgi:oligopeptide/dipeptide ABC transporter ATP-binding protein
LIDSSDVALEIEDLTVRLPTEAGTVEVVHDLSLTLRRGETLSVVGESGSGKSVTALAMMGLLPKGSVVTGSIRLGGRELVGASESSLRAVRGKNLAMIFQDPMSSLNPVMRIGAQIAEAVRAHDSVTRTEAATRAVELLRMVGVPDAEARALDYPHQFSGGMRQRVVIAIAMANRPDVIIADEPTTALDVTVQAQVLESLAKAQAESGAAMLLITHDLGVVASRADRVLVMYAGRAVEVGTADQVFYDTRMPYTLGLLGSVPRLDAPRGSTSLTPIPGAPPALGDPASGCAFAARCPLASEPCETRPTLVPTGAQDHLAACHFAGELADVTPADLFGPAAPHVSSAGRAALSEADCSQEETRG